MAGSYCLLVRCQVPTSESRTGASSYSRSYTLDGVGNRTAQTVGGTTTSFTINSDDELTATSGGFTNSYSYNSNGEQTGRTLSGTAWTLAYDYEGRLTSTATGGSTVSSFAYDALGSRQPNASWDDNPGTHGKPHWDVTNPEGPRTRFDENGVAVPRDLFPSPPSPAESRKAVVTIVVVAAVVIGGLVLCCFEGDTPVMMADGTRKRIDEVRKGDWVLARDEVTGEVRPKRVLSTSRSISNDRMSLEFNEGERISMTPGHPILVKGKGFIPAYALERYMECQSSAGQSTRISRIELTGRGVPRHVYNLEVDGYHTCSVGKSGILVHDLIPQLLFRTPSRYSLTANVSPVGWQIVVLAGRFPIYGAERWSSLTRLPD